jgi:hypothetical protein
VKPWRCRHGQCDKKFSHIITRDKHEKNEHGAISIDQRHPNARKRKTQIDEPVPESAAIQWQEAEVDPNEVDIGIHGEPEEEKKDQPATEEEASESDRPEDINVTDTHPFKNFTRGLVVLTLVSIGSLSREHMDVIVNMLLTPGFDPDELREDGISGHTILRDIDKMTDQMHPSRTTERQQAQRARRTVPIARTGKEEEGYHTFTARDSKAHRQEILSINDYVKLDFANPEVRPHIRLGNDQVADDKPVKEFNQTTYCHEFRRNSELVDFYIKQERYQLGQFVEYKESRNGQTGVMRLDRLKYRKPNMRYLRNARSVEDIVSQRPQNVWPVLQCTGPRMEGQTLIRDAEQENKWIDVAYITKRLEGPKPRLERDAEGNVGQHEEWVPEFGVQNIRPGQEVVWVSIFIDGFGKDAVNVSMRYDNLSSRVRDSTDFVRALTVTSKGLPLTGTDHALTPLCAELDKFGPGTDGVRVFDCDMDSYR